MQLLSRPDRDYPEGDIQCQLDLHEILEDVSSLN